MQITPDQLSQCRSEALDPVAMSARRDLADALGPTLKATGERIHVYGFVVGDGRTAKQSPYGNGDDGVVELGFVVQAAADLVVSSASLLRAGNVYSAASLIRQLVETEYLIWSFGERDEAVGEWLRSSHQERLRRWSPAVLRRLSGGKFDTAEYQMHCELGGHPTPPGVRALFGASVSSELMPELLWHEVCEHGRRIWNRLLQAAESLIPASTVLDGVFVDRELHETFDQWNTSDQLAQAIQRQARENEGVAARA